MPARPRPRRAVTPQSSTLDLGLGVHQASLAGADVTPQPGAAVTDRGTIGTRQCDSDQRVRKRQAQAQDLVCGYDAGPWGPWLYR